MLESLGINPVLLIAQAISFGVLYYVLNKFLFSQIRTALDERTAAVNKTLADKSEIEHRLQAFEQEQKAAHKKAAEEVQKMMVEAKDAAAATKAELVAKARDSANAEIVVAQKRIEQEKLNAEVEVSKHAKSLAQSIVQQLLAEKSSDPQWQQEQIKASLETLKQSKSWAETPKVHP